ncbi:ParA family protein [Pseudomonas sp. Pseusp97]|uniref:ParA family protein n=1 Tax=Pseudomonas sp. Pseusp97 TaxID=3243065 RepID=UPI0039A6D35E
MTRIVTLYNHKGGVSKTSTTFNLSYYLARQNKRVLIVDADAQCNMTEICLAPTLKNLDEQSEHTGQTVETLPGTTLLDILRPRFEGEVAAIDTTAIQTIPISDNLDLIRGSVDINSVDDVLAEAHNQRFSTSVHQKRNYVAIGDMLARIGAERNYDYIFIDVGPSSGALTRSCFLSSDSFFIPIAADRFNIQALRTLSQIIDRWISEHQQIFSEFSNLGLPVRPGLPSFLGVIAQFFKLYKGRPKPGYVLWMERIPETIEKYLYPVLIKHSSSQLDLTSGIAPKDATVVQIPDFGSLAPLMHETGKPVFEITREDTGLLDEDGRTWAGNVWGEAIPRMERYKSCFAEIAKRL